jgi:hypothetical protein
MWEFRKRFFECLHRHGDTDMSATLLHKSLDWLSAETANLQPHQLG